MAHTCLIVILLSLTTICNVSFAKSTYDGDPYWKRFDPETSTLPVDAINGGFEHESLYIIRSKHKESLTPGKFKPSQHKAFISWNHETYLKNETEVLCGDNFKWVPTTKSQILATAVEGGKSENDLKETLYICRAKYLGYTIPGKVHPSHETCYIAYEGKEIRVDSYEILTVPERRKPVVLGSKFITTMVDQTVNIECSILEGVPKPKITWQFNGKEIVSKTDLLIITKVKAEDAGSYKCIAQNIMGKDEYLTNLIVQTRPIIISSYLDVYKAVEEIDSTLSIPCVATGLPKPNITWEATGITISPSTKFSIVNGNLIINKPTVSDTLQYTCKARNVAGSTYATVKVDIQQVPKVIGEINKRVVKGQSVAIECRVTKGVPKPTITWQMKSKINSAFVAIPGSEKVLRISKVDINHAGIYKCIARNIVGVSAHFTTLVVEYAPIVTANNSTIYRGIEGDIALRVPCAAIGVPDPIVTWKVDGVTITPNAHYTIADGVLIIKDPKKSDSKLYTCEAKNYLGHVQASYTAEVSQFLDDFGTTKEVHILRGTTTNLECVSTDPSQSIKWFIEGNDSGRKGKYFHFTNADVSLDGNYTCRISDINGAQTRTYVVIVGYPPSFTFEQDSILDWSGREDDELVCEVDAKPAADYVWKYNGKILVNQKSSTLAVPGKWGHYACDASNYHGSVHRNFEVVSSDCLIARKQNINMPLILTSKLTWPVLHSTADYIKIKAGQTVVFFCSNNGTSKNSLIIFPETNEISATCDKQDIFIVRDKPYKFLDFRCTYEIDAMVIPKPVKCLTETSKLMGVGYKIHGFLDSYDVCFDTSTNMPLYTRVTMSKSNLGRYVSPNWYIYPGITRNNSKAYTCKASTSRCCYSKTQLVNARDFSDGPTQKSTFIDSLNAIPYWRPCDIEQSPWEGIEDMVRSRLNIYDEFVAWSGTHRVQEINGGSIPRYLWKVLRFDEEESIAIIYVNGPTPTEADILCKNTCPDDSSVPWIYTHNKYFYCCDIHDFLRAFNLSSTSIGSSF